MSQGHHRGDRGGGGWGRGGGGWGKKRGGRGGGGWGRNRDRRDWGGSGREGGTKLPEGVDADNPVIKMFQGHAKALDRKNDKYERILKMARDVTIESKRIIFLLHRIMREDDKATLLGEAEEKFRFIRSRLWLNIAKELRNEQPYQFLRAYSGGLQEYVEAYSFYYYILSERLVEWKEIQKELTFFWYLEAPKKQYSRRGSKTPVEGDEAKGDITSTETIDLSEALAKVVAEDVESDKKTEASSSESDKKDEDSEPKKAKASSESNKKAEKSKPKKEENTSGSNNKKDKKEENADTSTSDNKKENVADTPVTDSKKENKKEDHQGDSSTANTTEPDNEAKKSQEEGENGDKEEETASASGDGCEDDKKANQEKTEIEVKVPEEEFILGLADLTGEVMRQAINMVGAGETEVCFKLLEFLHQINKGFEDVNVVSRFHNKELRMKIRVLEQSLKKVENACFTIEVRGSEIPKEHLAGVFRSAADTGYYSHQDQPNNDVDGASNFSD